MIDVSICIVTYNSQEYISKCIKSIKEKTIFTKYEILIIDNDSTDNTIKNIECFEEVKLKKNTHNTGYAHAANKIAKEAKGKYILFLNPDVILKNNAIDILFKKAINTPEHNLFGGKILNENNKFIYSFGFLPSLKNILLICSGNHKYITPHKQNINIEQKTEIISGCCFFIKRELFEFLQGFDENYFMYYEEIDFCKRMKNNKHTALYIPQAELIHYIAKSERSKSHTFAYNFRSAYLYSKKHLVLNRFSFLLRTIFLIILFTQKKNINNTTELKKTRDFILEN